MAHRPRPLHRDLRRPQLAAPARPGHGHGPAGRAALGPASASRPCSVRAGPRRHTPTSTCHLATPKHTRDRRVRPSAMAGQPAHPTTPCPPNVQPRSMPSTVVEDTVAGPVAAHLLSGTRPRPGPGTRGRRSRFPRHHPEHGRMAIQPVRRLRHPPPPQQRLLAELGVGAPAAARWPRRKLLLAQLHAHARPGPCLRGRRRTPPPRGDLHHGGAPLGQSLANQRSKAGAPAPPHHAPKHCPPSTLVEPALGSGLATRLPPGPRPCRHSAAPGRAYRIPRP